MLNFSVEWLKLSPEVCLLSITPTTNSLIQQEISADGCRRWMPPLCVYLNFLGAVFISVYHPHLQAAHNSSSSPRAAAVLRQTNWGLSACTEFIQYRDMSEFWLMIGAPGPSPGPLLAADSTSSLSDTGISNGGIVNGRASTLIKLPAYGRNLLRVVGDVFIDAGWKTFDLNRTEIDRQTHKFTAFITNWFRLN